MFFLTPNLFSKRPYSNCAYGILNFRFFGSAIEGNENNSLKENLNKKKLNTYYLQNKDRMKEYHREYYLQNKDKMKASKREYYLKNKDKIKEHNKKEKYMEYCKKNKEKKKEYDQKYNIQNKEKKKDYNREYRKQNKEKLKEYYLLHKDRINDFYREYYLQNKENIKQSNIKKNIERNNGVYVPLNSWIRNESVREYFERIAPLLHINDLSDWYRISRNQIIDMKGGGIFNQFNSLGEALKVAYPDYDWDMSKLSFKGKKSSQRWLYVKLKKLIPNAVIIEEYDHPELLWEDNSKKCIQLDIWIPEYNLALEYQGGSLFLSLGEHHYFDLPGAFGPGSTTMIFNERDEKKKQLCASKGIKLVCIPYWWDGHEDSLCSTLHTIFPEFFENTDSPPIPNNLPTGYNLKE